MSMVRETGPFPGKPAMQKWSIEEAKEHYRIYGWGAGYFDINEKGNVVAQPKLNSEHGIDLKHMISNPKVILCLFYCGSPIF